MTPTFRLFLASALAVMALLAGVLQTSEQARLLDAADARAWSTIQMVDADAVDALVNGVVSAGLFPNARLRDDPETTNLDIAGIEAAFVDPSLAALVRLNGEWTIHIRANDGSAHTLKVDDLLIDDWHISQITPTSVTFERNDETRRIDAFPTRNE